MLDNPIIMEQIMDEIEDWNEDSYLDYNDEY
jgi:hypothetical protein